MDRAPWDESDGLSTQTLAAGMDESVRALFNQVCALDGGCRLLRLLHNNANSLMTVDDIAFHIKQSPAAVEQNLRRLVEWEWARRLDLPEFTWFGLTSDSQRRQIIRELFAWQERWYARLDRIRLAVDGLLAQA